MDRSGNGRVLLGDFLCVHPRDASEEVRAPQGGAGAMRRTKGFCPCLIDRAWAGAHKLGAALAFGLRAFRFQPQRCGNFSMKSKVLLILFLVMLGSVQLTLADKPIRVLVWDERQPEQRNGYSGHFLGDAIASHLQTKEGFVVSSACLDTEQQGLGDHQLDSIDVIIWWGHRRHHEVAVEASQRLVKRVLTGQIAMIALHSSHFSRPFMALMDERSKADAPEMIPSVDQAGSMMDFDTPLRRGMAGPNDAISPTVEKVEGTWRLILPACVFPEWRADGKPSRMTTLLSDHPIAKGLPKSWIIPQTEMYNEPFHIPSPDSVVFEERWEGGAHFRSACVWKVGQGQVFYFRPGHETYPIYKQKENLLVLENAIRWLSSHASSNRKPDATGVAPF